jgi:RHS repeat-associated protein
VRKSLVVMLVSAVVSATLIYCPSVFAGNVWSLYINNVNTNPSPLLTQNQLADIYAEIRTSAPIRSTDGSVDLYCYVQSPSQSDFELWDQKHLSFNLDPGQTSTIHFDDYTFSETGYYWVEVVMTDPGEGGAIIDQFTNYNINVIPEPSYLHIEVDNDDDDNQTVEYKIDAGSYSRSISVNSEGSATGPQIPVTAESHTVKIRWLDPDVGDEQTQSKTHTVSSGEDQEYHFTIPEKLLIQSITALQQTAGAVVDIYYDLNYYAGASIEVAISSDGGATWDVPAISLSGDVGENVSAGAGKHIVWDAAADWPGNYSFQMIVRLAAIYDSGQIYEVDSPLFSYQENFSLEERDSLQFDSRYEGDISPDQLPWVKGWSGQPEPHSSSSNGWLHMERPNPADQFYYIPSPWALALIPNQSYTIEIRCMPPIIGRLMFEVDDGGSNRDLLHIGTGNAYFFVAGTNSHLISTYPSNVPLTFRIASWVENGARYTQIWKNGQPCFGPIQNSGGGYGSQWIAFGDWSTVYPMDVEIDYVRMDYSGAFSPRFGPQGDPPDVNYFLGLLQLLGFSNDPVNTATGNFIHQETDLSIATRGNPLVFSRFYNSKDSRVTSIGQGWTHSYNIILSQEPNRVNIRWGDGHTDYWDANGSAYEPNTVGLYDKLVKNPDNTWKVTKKNLDKYNLDMAGRLMSISDKNGNVVSLSYSHPTDANLVTAVSDAAGRTIAFGYTGTLLTSVSDFDSPARTVQFSYTSGRLTQVTDVMSNTIRYGYDSNDYLETITDQRGVTTVTNTYDGLGRVIEQYDGNDNKTIFAYDTPDVNKTTITDPNGNTTIHIHGTGYKLLCAIQDPLGQNVYFNYDEQGNRTSITDRNGNTTYFNYDNRGNIITKTAADGGITVFDYNDSNLPDLPTRIIDALGNITQWQYDSNANVISQIDPNGNERTFTYNAFGEKLTEKDENGNTARYIYDANGLLTEVVDPNGNHSWYSYDGLWRLTHITDGRGSGLGDPAHTTITTYDKADRVTSITGPITSESYQYDNIGSRTHLTNRRGYTTVFYYDNNKNLTRIERPAPGGQTQVIQYGYDKLNRKVSSTDPNGNVTNYEYDPAGRLVKAKNPENDQTAYTYDAHGNVLSVTDGNGVTTYYGYDSLNRKNHQYDELGNHWYWEYDKLGRMKKHTDAMGYKTNYEYDSLGRLIRVIDDANKVTQYKYDAVGNLKEIIDAAGVTTEKRFYDTANRLNRKEDGLGHTYEYSYDRAGNIISEKSPNNQTKTFVYDNENRLIQIHYPDSSQVIYSYNNNGNLTSMTDPTGTTIYVYDELDRLTSNTDSFGKQVQYGYNITGNRTSITYPADSNNPARTVAYTYDKANRLDKIIGWAGRIWDYKVDKAGRIKDVNFPNGIKELLSYDTAGRLSGLAYKTSGDSNLISYSYTRNGQGEPIDISESGTLEPVLNLPLKEDYSYDNDNRLTETTKPATYGYDNNGNMTSRVAGGVTTTFTYDFENRMTSQTTGSSTVQHIYDGRGNRIARNNNGSVTHFVLDRGRSMSHILCETNSSGNIIAYYIIHGPQIVGRIGTDGSQRYYHTDHIGNIVALTNESQTVTDRYVYTPFGEISGHEGTTANPFTYVGGLGVMAEADGLYFMRARFYDPASGRFLSKDPFGGDVALPVSLHKYLYAGNIPLSFIDPTGWVMTRSEMPGDPMLTSAMLQQQTQEAKNSASQILFGTSDAEFFDPAALSCFLNSKYGATQTACSPELVQQGSRMWQKMHPQVNPDWETIINAFRYIGEGALCLGGTVGTSGFASAAACAPLVTHAGTDLAHAGCDAFAGGDKGCHSAVDWISLEISFVTLDSSGALSGVVKVGKYGALAAKTIGTTGKLAQNYGATGSVVNGTIWQSNVAQTVGTYMQFWP